MLHGTARPAQTFAKQHDESLLDNRISSDQAFSEACDVNGREYPFTLSTVSMHEGTAPHLAEGPDKAPRRMS